LLGDKFTLNGTRKRIFEITSDPELATFGVKAGYKLDPQDWLEESRALAIENVYAPEVLQSLELVSRGLITKPETIDLSEEYLKNAGRIAQRRAIEAAHRLAAEWRAIQ